MALLTLARRTAFSVGIVVIFSLTESQLGWAQGGATGAIMGAVLDTSGAVMPSAAVQIIDADTGQPVRNLTTGSSGSFRAALLPPAPIPLW